MATSKWKETKAIYSRNSWKIKKEKKKRSSSSLLLLHPHMAEAYIYIYKKMQFLFFNLKRESFSSLFTSRERLNRDKWIRKMNKLISRRIHELNQYLN
jgi:hypothetical protein